MITIPTKSANYDPEKGGNRGVNLPSPYFLSQFLPPPYFFEPISPSSLNGYVLFLPPPYFFPLFLPPPNFFWAISPSSLFCSSPLRKHQVLSQFVIFLLWKSIIFQFCYLFVLYLQGYRSLTSVKLFRAEGLPYL